MGDAPVDETGIILWRHVAFHVTRSSIQGQLNGLLAEITLIGLFEDSCSQGLRKSFVIQHDPHQLFDVLGYLLALAIHDDVFATGLKDVKQVRHI